MKWKWFYFQASDLEGTGDVGLSVLKLRELSKAGELFDSYSSSGDDEDSGIQLFISCLFTILN